MPITITPQQAAHGVILPVQLANGPARLRIPACRNGDLVRARVGEQELLLRIRVSGGGGAAAGAGGGAGAGAGVGAAFATGRLGATAGGGTGGGAGGGAGSTPQPAPSSSTANGRGCLAAFLVAAVIAVVVIAVNSGDDDAGNSAVPAPTYSTGALSPSSAAPWSAEPTVAPNPVPTPYSAAPAPVPTPEPSPFDRGTCLNGQLPDSTTPTTVSGVDEVSCSASDAHYKVIESIPGTSDMDRCNSNPKTQYAFSYRYTRGATVLNQYVYCLIGLGSYAR
ncbi:hypothetical protein ACFWA6_31115 [Streptomyces sp. NPDC060020]|uniref:LppU/SCO3897 family protein n=1 Tax=Streptomyces sp. NPDC060020 TaxID=3347038 RepID=UPI0036CA1730